MADRPDPERWEQPLLVIVTGLPGTGKSTVAGEAGSLLGAPVLGHDWAMSGLRPYAAVQEALESMDPPGHRAVGWSILCALARAQLRRASSVVLDGVARVRDIERCRQAADEEGGQLVVILTECADLEVHRSRVEGRDRAIPDWYELDWDHVQLSRAGWEAPDRVDLRLQATDTLQRNTQSLASLLRRVQQRQVRPFSGRRGEAG